MLESLVTKAIKITRRAVFGESCKTNWKLDGPTGDRMNQQEKKTPKDPDFRLF
ncbi:MAG: hypothetical protein JSW60_09685 [Thermoplasmatales archaeon]|nr:MAG: hypothetical protein JSW60_09685 [Thermoplasmatales archaeon]